MILVHGTSKNGRDSILAAGKINPSTFDFDAYLNELKNMGDQLTAKKNCRLPKDLVGEHAMWLGEGIYAFEGTDYNLAHSWKTRYRNPIPLKDCDVISLNIDFNTHKKKILNMSSKPGKDLLHRFIYKKLAPKFKKREEEAKLDQNQINYNHFIIFLGMRILREDFYSDPHALGFFIELMKQENFENINKYSIIKGTFTKNKDNRTPTNVIYLETYICIKDSSVIKDIC
ncbi:hypothetical protein AB6889_12120 [Carnobacterium maltaromaticum]|uniref:hypothetical protein n=1 Tax=Carnobacterium maltaromaticum TaxID=2751 RepID=UPI0039BDFB56